MPTFSSMCSKMHLDLRQDHVHIIRSILETYVPGIEVWAFGSRVRAEARPASDLDIVLMTDQPLDWLTLAELCEAFSVSMLPMKVDVLDWSVLSQEMRERIEHEHIVL